MACTRSVIAAMRPMLGPVGTRTFRLHEANRALPEVRRLVGQIVELSGQLDELTDEVRIAEYRARRDGASLSERERYEESAEALRAAEDDLVAAIGALQQMGVELKDPRSGLVDFLSYRDGELVELCWQLGEDRVAHWHHIGEGFPGRKPV